MAQILPPPPTGETYGTFPWLDWFHKLRLYISQTGALPWSVIDFTGSSIADIADTDHSKLDLLQGGSAGQYYHLTSAQHTDLLDGGESSLHYHTSAPTFNVGNVAGGNYIEIEADGTIEFHGNATVWDDLRIEPVIKAVGINDPTFTKWFDNGSGSRGVYVYNFSDEITANQKELFFTIELPHGWKEGTTIYPHIHWIPNSNGTSQRPVFGFEYTWSEKGSVFGNTAIIYTDTLSPNDANLVQYKHYVSRVAAGITPSSSQNEFSSILIGRLFRFSGDASDTFTGICGVLHIDFHYESDTLGSRTVDTK
jgi:hypothetical protein